MTAQVWCQTSDKSYMTAHVWCQTFWHQMCDVWYHIRHLITVTWQQTSDIRCLLSYNWYQTSAVWFSMLCYITVIRRLMSNIRRLVTVIWQQMSDNSYMTADVLYEIRHLITVTWQQMSYVKCLISHRLRAKLRLDWLKRDFSQSRYHTSAVI